MEDLIFAINFISSKFFIVRTISSSCISIPFINVEVSQSASLYLQDYMEKHSDCWKD